MGEDLPKIGRHHNQPDGLLRDEGVILFPLSQASNWFGNMIVTTSFARRISQFTRRDGERGLHAQSNAQTSRIVASPDFQIIPTWVVDR
jgi:hypothetical protein